MAITTEKFTYILAGNSTKSVQVDTWCVVDTWDFQVTIKLSRLIVNGFRWNPGGQMWFGKTILDLWDKHRVNETRNLGFYCGEISGKSWRWWQARKGVGMHLVLFLRPACVTVITIIIYNMSIHWFWVTSAMPCALCKAVCHPCLILLDLLASHAYHSSHPTSQVLVILAHICGMV
jgi:hypothetical protein